MTATIINEDYYYYYYLPVFWPSLRMHCRNFCFRASGQNYDIAGVTFSGPDFLKEQYVDDQPTFLCVFSLYAAKICHIF